LAYSKSSGFLIHAQNRRKAYEQIADHAGGPCMIVNSEMSTLIGRFDDPKYKAETVFCELGDQTTDSKDYSTASYSVREIKVLRSCVMTVGTYADLRWLLNSYVICMPQCL